MDEEVGFEDLITQFVSYELESVNTAIPAIILGVKKKGEELLLDVQPSVSISTMEGEVFSETSILNVPMQQPASSKGGMIFPPDVGDTVLLVFSQNGIDTWKYGTGQPQPPSDFRRFNKRDCVAIPCIFPVSRSMAKKSAHGQDYDVGDVIIYNSRKSNPVEIILKESGDVFINSPGKVTVNCVDSEVNASSSVTYNTQSYKINCSSYTVSSSSYSINTGTYGLSATSSATTSAQLDMQGSFTLNGVTMETHTHGGVQTGSGSTGGPQ